MGAVLGPFFSHGDNFSALSGPGVVQDPKSRRSAVTVTAAAGINYQLFVALNYLPLTTAASISFTSPFIVTALSVPLLGERVGPRRWTAVAIGFTGALIIIRPAGASFHGAELFVIASATFYSFYQIMTRRLVV